MLNYLGYPIEKTEKQNHYLWRYDHNKACQKYREIPQMDVFITSLIKK